MRHEVRLIRHRTSCRQHEKTAHAHLKSCQSALQLHLQLEALKAADLLEAVNKRRKLLALPEIPALAADTKVDEGLAAGAARPEVNKQSALRDLKALADASKGFVTAWDGGIPDHCHQSTECSRRTPLFYPHYSAGPSLKKGLSLSKGPLALYATRLGRMSSTCETICRRNWRSRRKRRRCGSSYRKTGPHSRKNV